MTEEEKAKWLELNKACEQEHVYRKHQGSLEQRNVAELKVQEIAQELIKKGWNAKKYIEAWLSLDMDIVLKSPINGVIKGWRLDDGT